MYLNIYLDVDDTLADFQVHCRANGVPPWEGTWYTNHPSTWTPEQAAIDAHVVELMNSDSFWPNIPVKPGAFELISVAALRATTHLLTAYPKVCDDVASVTAQKLEYCKRVLHFPEDRIHVVARADKIKFATGKNAILVDDAERNCAEWEEAGGTAILFTTIDAAVRDLRALGRA